MKIQHYERFDITYLAKDSEEFARSIGFVDSSRPGTKLELDVASNPRNVDGYRIALGKDIAKLRRDGSVVIGKLTPEGEAAIKRGKVLDNRPEAQRDELVTPVTDPKHPDNKEAKKDKKA